MTIADAKPNITAESGCYPKVIHVIEIDTAVTQTYTQMTKDLIWLEFPDKH